MSLYDWFFLDFAVFDRPQCVAACHSRYRRAAANASAILEWSARRELTVGIHNLRYKIFSCFRHVPHDRALHREQTVQLCHLRLKLTLLRPHHVAHPCKLVPMRWVERVMRVQVEMDVRGVAAVAVRVPALGRRGRVAHAELAARRAGRIERLVEGSGKISFSALHM